MHSIKMNIQNDIIQLIKSWIDIQCVYFLNYIVSILKIKLFYNVVNSKVPYATQSSLEHYLQ